MAHWYSVTLLQCYSVTLLQWHSSEVPGDEVAPSEVLGHQDGVERGLKEADQLHHEGRLDQGTKNLSLATNFPFLLVGFSVGESYM